MMPPPIFPGTLYADWLRRRKSLGAYRGERESMVAIQLRVLDYLIERYHDDAAALLPAPPPLDNMYMNQRAIVVNHHRSLGLVAGVKSAQQARDRVAAIVARMNDSSQADHGIDLDRAAVADDPWFGWEEPDQRTVNEYWGPELFHPRWWGPSSKLSLKARIGGMPFLPTVFIDHLYDRVSALDDEDEYAADVLAACRNRITVSYVARAWRVRIAAKRYDGVTNKLRQTLVDWDHCAAETVRCLLSDESGEVRMAAAILLTEIGELRDIGIFADLLAMTSMPDEEPAERLVLVDAMEKLATRLRERRSALD